MSALTHPVAAEADFERLPLEAMHELSILGGTQTSALATSGYVESLRGRLVDVEDRSGALRLSELLDRVLEQHGDDVPSSSAAGTATGPPGTWPGSTGGSSSGTGNASNVMCRWDSTYSTTGCRASGISTPTVTTGSGRLRCGPRPARTCRGPRAPGRGNHRPVPRRDLRALHGRRSGRRWSTATATCHVDAAAARDRQLERQDAPATQKGRPA